MFEIFTRALFIKVKSRINGKEFVRVTRSAKALIFAAMTFAIATVSFFVGTVILQPLPDLVFFVILLVLFFYAIYLAFIKIEPKDYCSKAFLQLHEAINVWEQAGISKELANLMRIPVNLGMQKVIDFQKETGRKRCKLPDSFFFSIRRIVKKIDKEIFYQV